MITDINQLDFSKQYTYADYMQWRMDERVELIKGWLHRMSPAPMRRHQKISYRLETQIGSFMDDETCEVYHAPFDVRFLNKKKSTADQDIFTVVQPDICVICDKEKLDDRGCIGAPDWIIEIVSKGNTKKELETKFKLYEENGVREYWVVFMNDETVAVFDLVTEKYQNRKIYSNDEMIPVGILEGLEIDLVKVFEE